jgi:hypothetical protein
VSERVFRTYVLSHFSAVAEISQMALTAQALQAVQVTLKSVTNEGHFALETETVSLLFLPSHCSGVS